MDCFRIIIRAFETAYRSLNAVKWKSLISMVTIFIGALAITTTFTISRNVDGYVNYIIDINGGPTVSVFNFGGASFGPEEIKKLKKISIIKKVYLTDQASVNARFLDKSISLKLVPVTEDNGRYLPYKMNSGRFIASVEPHRTSNTVVLSTEAAKRFELNSFQKQKLNFTLKGGGEIPLEIIGVAESLDSEQDRGTAWVSLKLFQELTGKKEISQMKITSDGAGWMNWVENFSKDMLKEKFGSNLWLYNPLQQFEEQKEQLSTFIQMGYILGFLALVAGSIGSTSIMILNVNLRRREIGLYKSMGFSPMIILLQFTCETILLSLVGGLIGAFLGSALGLIISQNMFPVAELSLTGFCLGLLSALLTGLIFGLIPAVIAARIDPVKALQG